MSAVCLGGWLWLGILWAAVPGSASDGEGGAAEPPLRVAADLFNQSDPVTLGLPAAPAEHTVLYRATRDTYKFCHHQNLAVWQGRLYLMWSNGKVAEDFNGQRILYCWTANGSDWTTPRVLVDDHDGSGPMACVAAGWHPTKSGLVAYYTAIPEGQPGDDERNQLFYVTSEDGRVWSKGRPLGQGFYIEGPRLLPGGRLLMNGQWPRMQPRLRYTDSKDGVSNWQDGRFPEVEGIYSFPEPSWFVRPDGSITMIFRTKSGNPWLYASRSVDRGKSWSRPAQTEFPDATARAFAGNLPDGTAYLISNPSTTPSRTHPTIGRRSPLTIALSRDARTFDRAFTIRTEKTTMRFEGKNKVDGWQYPSGIVWGEFLYVAYSINKEDVGVSRIKLSDLKQPQ